MKWWFGSSVGLAVQWRIYMHNQDPVCVNSLWPSHVIWRHRSGSVLAQSIDFCLSAPSHDLNQYWRLFNEVSSARFSRIYPRVMSQKMLFILDMVLKITNLRLQPHLPWTHEFNNMPDYKKKSCIFGDGPNIVCKYSIILSTFDFSKATWISLMCSPNGYFWEPVHYCTIKQYTYCVMVYFVLLFTLYVINTGFWKKFGTQKRTFSPCLHISRDLVETFWINHATV